MEFSEFLRVFRSPIAGTGLLLAQLGLEEIPFLQRFAQKVGNGVFRNAIFSVASVREDGIDLGPWSKLVPSGSKHFATNGIGELFFIAPDQKIYVVMVHDADSTDLDTPADQFFDWLALPVNQDLYLSMTSFYIRPHEVKPNEVLTYEPPSVVSGRASGADLVPRDQKENLATLAKLHFGGSKGRR